MATPRKRNARIGRPKLPTIKERRARLGRPSVPFLQDPDRFTIALIEAHAIGYGKSYGGLSARTAARLLASIKVGKEIAPPPEVIANCPEGSVPIVWERTTHFFKDGDVRINSTRPGSGASSIENAADYFRQKTREAWKNPVAYKWLVYMVPALGILIRNPSAQGVELAKALIAMAGENEVNIDLIMKDIGGVTR